jgi:Carboxypeptidase regulatory-like domain
MGPALETLKKIEHEYSLRDELDSVWAVNPATGQVNLMGSGWLRARTTADSREIVRVVMNRILTLLVPIIACWMVTIPVIAQTTSGSISGTVIDASLAGVPGAQVTAINTQTGAQRASVTGGDGRYQLPVLPPGIYDLRVEEEGFNTIIQQGIVLRRYAAPGHHFFAGKPRKPAPPVAAGSRLLGEEDRLEAVKQ